MSSRERRAVRVALGAATAALTMAAAALPASALVPPITPPDPRLPAIIATPSTAPAPVGAPAVAAPVAVPPASAVTGALAGPTGTATGGSPSSGPQGGSTAAGPPPYTPPPEETRALPHEPDRLAYEQQQSDVRYDAERLDQDLAAAALGAGGGSGRFGWPVVTRGRPHISQRFGCTDLAGEPFNAGCASKRWHTGIDLAVPLGTPVFAADAGVVRTFRTDHGYGNYVLVVHGNGYATLYGHLRDFAVPDGAVVARGEPVGYAGSSGFSSGPHLHFEVRHGGTFVDPCAELGC